MHKLKAHEILNENNWIRDRLAEDDNGRSCEVIDGTRFCIRGVLMRVYSKNENCFYDNNVQKVENIVNEYLEKNLLGNDLINWNNSVATFQDVHNVLTTLDL